MVLHGIDIRVAFLSEYPNPVKTILLNWKLAVAMFEGKEMNIPRLIHQLVGTEGTRKRLASRPGDLGDTPWLDATYILDFEYQFD